MSVCDVGCVRFEWIERANGDGLELVERVQDDERL